MLKTTPDFALGTSAAKEQDLQITYSKNHGSFGKSKFIKEHSIETSCGNQGIEAGPTILRHKL
jgi:hypothetical protein